MDISVSRLNNRMVLQVPPELPLGLVFVIGRVCNLRAPEETPTGETSFDLLEAGHTLHCRLTARVAEEVLLSEGDSIRAGGHLAFDTQEARYYLKARDIELVADLAASRTKIGPIIADLERRAEAVALVRADLPPWVKRLAPPEVQAELGLLSEDGQNGYEEELYPTLESQVGKMSDEMVAFLADAMDQQQEVELTPDLLARLLPVTSPEVQEPEGDSTGWESEPLMAEADEVSILLQDEAGEGETFADPGSTHRGESTGGLRRSSTRERVIVVGIIFLIMALLFLLGLFALSFVSLI